MAKSSFTSWLAEKIETVGKSTRELADEVGYPHPNMISMIKTGLVTLPAKKVPAFAKALGVDPAYMVRLYLEENDPDRYQAITSVLGEILSENEREVLSAIRRMSGGSDPKPEVVMRALRM